MDLAIQSGAAAETDRLVEVPQALVDRHVHVHVQRTRLDHDVEVPRDRHATREVHSQHSSVGLAIRAVVDVRGFQIPSGACGEVGVRAAIAWIPRRRRIGRTGATAHVDHGALKRQRAARENLMRLRRLALPRHGHDRDVGGVARVTGAVGVRIRLGRVIRVRAVIARVRDAVRVAVDDKRRGERGFFAAHRAQGRLRDDHEAHQHGHGTTDRGLSQCGLHLVTHFQISLISRRAMKQNVPAATRRWPRVIDTAHGSCRGTSWCR